jgi:hypothetical protein
MESGARESRGMDRRAVENRAMECHQPPAATSLSIVPANVDADRDADAADADR